MYRMGAGRHRRDQGFTLLEVLVIVFLVGLLSGLVMVSIGAILNGIGTPPIDRTLRNAVREARYQAASTKEPVTLRYDEEAGAFVIEDSRGKELLSIPTGYGADPRDLEIAFFQVLPWEGTASIRDQETVPIPAVTFHPDRSSTPFAVELEVERERETLRFDPFSDIVLPDET